MRALNIADTVDTYTPWPKPKIVKSALIEAALALPREKRGDDAFLAQRETGKRLLKQYTQDGLGRLIDEAHEITGKGLVNLEEIATVHRLLGFLSDSDSWHDLAYGDLENNRIIIPFTHGTLYDLAELMACTPETKVVDVRTFPVDPRTVPDKPGFDYVKKIPEYNKLLLNGKLVIKHFAREHGVMLPESYLQGNGSITAEVKDILSRAGFHFREALEHAAAYLQENPSRFVASFVIKTKNGTEVRYTPFNSVIGEYIYTEICQSEARQARETGEYNRTITWQPFTQNGQPAEYQYVRFHVPIRDAFGIRERHAVAGESTTHDYVEFQFLDYIQNPNAHVLSWMETLVHCHDPYAMNLRNFRQRRGEKILVCTHFDEHAMVALEATVDARENAVRNWGYRIIAHPTAEHMRYTDRCLYNMFEGNSAVGVEKLRLLANESMKLPGPFSTKFSDQKPREEDVLRPIYLVTDGRCRLFAT